MIKTEPIDDLKPILKNLVRLTRKIRRSIKIRSINSVINRLKNLAKLVNQFCKKIKPLIKCSIHDYDDYSRFIKHVDYFALIFDGKKNIFNLIDNYVDSLKNVEPEIVWHFNNFTSSNRIFIISIVKNAKILINSHI